MRELVRLYFSYMKFALACMTVAGMAVSLYVLVSGLYRLERADWSNLLGGILATKVQVWGPILIVVVIVLVIILGRRGTGRGAAA